MRQVRQASLGGTKTVRNPIPDGFKLAKVTSVDEYSTHGRIQVAFLREKGMPTPVWVIESGAARKPVKDDFVLIGFLDNEGNNPFLAGFYNVKSHTSNFIYIGDDKIRIQFPTQNGDIYDSTQKAPNGSHLTNDSQYLSTRVYIDLEASGLTIHAPSGVPVKIVSDSVQFVSQNGTVRSTI